MRIRCILFGCRLHDLPACHRCQAALYDADFIQMGRLEPLTDGVAHLRAIFSADNLRCTECRRLLSLPQLVSEWRRSGEFCGIAVTKFCSDKCRDDWFPF